MNDAELNIVRKVVEETVDPVITGLAKIQKILIGNGDVKGSICYRVARNEDDLKSIAKAGLIEKVNRHDDFIKSFRMSPGWIWSLLTNLIGWAIVIFLYAKH